jgi:hypothetical protein
MSANWVTELVRSKIQTPSAKLVRPDPMTETHCPSQTIENVVIPRAMVFCVIEGSLYRIKSEMARMPSR